MPLPPPTAPRPPPILRISMAHASITPKMSRFIASCLLCLLLSVAPPSCRGGVGARFASAASSSIRSPSGSSAPPYFRPPLLSIGLKNETDGGAGNATAPNATSAPTPQPTHNPTKQYHPSPDDDEEGEKKHEGTRVGIIFLWIVVAFTLIWLVCYFRDAIMFFFGNAWNNTRRYGCRGCLQSFFPCVFRSPSGGSEPLDQIIFETEDPNAPLMT